MGFFEGNNLVIAFMNFSVGKVMAVSVCLRPGFLSSHAFETSPCLSMHCCCQVRVQEEDETALPQKIPASFSFYCSTGWRGHTPWTAVYEASPLPALSDVAVSQKFSTEPHPAIPRAPATDFLPSLE